MNITWCSYLGTTIVCAYLMRYMHMSLRDAYLLCKKHRPICFPNLGFWAQLIAYEHQLRKDNSVRSKWINKGLICCFRSVLIWVTLWWIPEFPIEMRQKWSVSFSCLVISTQFGHIPDVALEEIKQMRQQMPMSLPFSPPTFVSAPSNPSYSSYSQNDPSSNQARPTARDMSISNSYGTVRSRSLAPNPAIRPSVVAASTHVSNPAYQTPLFTSTNKPVYSNPTRFDLRRLNPAAAAVAPPLPPPAPVGSSLSFASSRSLPAQKSSNLKPATNYYPVLARQQQGAVTARESNSAAHSGHQRSQYETTYRASFIKPLVP